MKVWLIILLMHVCCLAYTQTVNVTLSPDHQRKVNAAKTGRKKILKLYKYHKKDSARALRSSDKRTKHEMDSTWKSDRKQRRLMRRLVRKGVPLPKELATVNTLSGELNFWYAVMNDTTLADSTRAIAKENVRTLAAERASQNPTYQMLLEKYKLTGDTANWEALSRQVSGLDTLKGVFNSSPETLFRQSEKLVQQNLSKIPGVGSATGNLTKANDMKNMTEKFKARYNPNVNPDDLKAKGKTAVTENAVGQLDKVPPGVMPAQAKVSRLVSKYKQFNSDNMGDAKKRSSMQGTTLFERLVIGGSFNLISVKPVSLDLSPELGYKFTSRLFVGVGMNYRCTFGDTIRNSRYISPRNTGVKAYISYDVIKNFYAYGEWNMARLKQAGEGTQKQWINNYFLGAGRKFLVHPKLYLTLTALYNLNNEKKNSSYINRFQVRIGFQLSELATRKKKIYYDPD